MEQESRNAVVGGFTLLILVFLGVLAFSGIGSKAETGYTIRAAFDKIDGLSVGGEVRMGGIPVGRVESLSLDENFRAVTGLRILPGVEIPDDTAAAVHTDGLFGAKFITLDPGGGDNLTSGGEITVTQGSLVLQDLLGLIIGQAKANRATRQNQAK